MYKMSCPFCKKIRVLVHHLPRCHGVTITQARQLFPDLQTQPPQWLDGIEGVDFITCPICRGRYKQITVHHIKMHGLTIPEFHEQFPKITSLICEKTRDKISGPNNQFFGKKHTEEFCISQSQRMSGPNHPNYGKPRPQETRDKIALANTGKKHSPETLRKMSKIRKDYFAAMTPEEHDLYCQTKKEILARPDVKEKHKQSVLAFWADPEKHLVALQKRKYNPRIPTKPEINLLAILNFNFLGRFKYTGNGSCWISAKDQDGKLYHLNPDFISTNGDRLIIEMFGDYWHGEEFYKDKPAQEEKFRSYLFSVAGFRTLIIWEHEFCEPSKIVQKIERFLSPPGAPAVGGV